MKRVFWPLVVLLSLVVGKCCFAEGNQLKTENESFAALPYGITSFGAARLGDALYVYGGHTGSAHSYSKEEQTNELLMLDLKQPKANWNRISTGRRLQGLALVAHDNRLISVGGFQAMNEEGEEQDLHSQDFVTAFDTVGQTWSELPALPSPRSSHDAVVAGNTLYVVGGWNMQTESNDQESETETDWHQSAVRLDLGLQNANWQELPQPPFERRALCLAAHDGKVFAIGGMQRRGGPTTAVAIFDPQSNSWSEGPSLQGENTMVGFGASAWSQNGQLIVTCYNGDVQRLTSDGKAWERLGQTRDARFFHRLLPLAADQLISVGGANMESGKFLSPERIWLAD